MASKSAVYKDYLIVQEDSGSIKLLRIYDNVKDSLRQIAKVVGFSTMIVGLLANLAAN